MSAFLVVLGLLATAMACHAVPAQTTLELDKDVSIKVDYKTDQSFVEFHSCDVKDCALLWFIRAPKDDADKAFATTFTTCKNKENMAEDCQEMPQEAKGFDRFSTGTLEFAARRTSSKLLVWLKGHSNNAVELPIKATFDKLRITPSVSRDPINVWFDGVKP